MNALNTHLHLVEFLCFGAMLCVLLFSLIIVGIIIYLNQKLINWDINWNLTGSNHCPDSDCHCLYSHDICQQCGPLLCGQRTILSSKNSPQISLKETNCTSFQSFEIAIAAYESNWMDYDVDTQKTLKFLIMRSQKPLAVRFFQHFQIVLLAIICFSDSRRGHLPHESENVAIAVERHLLLFHPTATRLWLRKTRLQGYTILGQT